MKNIFVILAIAFIMQSCVSSLSQYQGAKTLGQGNISNTLVGQNTFNESGNETMLAYVYSRGINNKTDLGFGFGIARRGYGFGTNIKRAIIEDRLSLNLPLVYKQTIYDDSRIEVSPSLLFTYNPQKKIKNTLNFQLIFEKYLYPDIPGTESSFYLSHNWEFNKNKFYFYPEIGLQNYGIGTDNVLIKFGLGFSYKRIN
tara:strand:+ start:169 stop:765 length:597 start_codon:yes stop_codon:yes gene_type:complete